MWNTVNKVSFHSSLNFLFRLHWNSIHRSYLS